MINMESERAIVEEYTIHANCNARALAEDGWCITELTSWTGKALWWPIQLCRKFAGVQGSLPISGEAVCHGMRCGVKRERILICSGEIRFDGKKLLKWIDDAGYEILKRWLKSLADDDVDDFGILPGKDQVMGGD